MGGERTDMPAALSAAEAASLLGWWLESGVDVPVQDQPRNWLAGRTPAAPEAPAPAEPPPPEAPAPATLAEFRQWLAESPTLPLAASGAKRILPVGAEGAAVMVLTDLPTADEAAEGRPIGGEARLLAERMLAAIGIRPDAAYFAPLACFHSPGERASEDELRACGEIARRHVALAAPKRLLLLGDGPARALLGKPAMQARSSVHKIEGVRAVATLSPRQLLKSPSAKALAWRDLLLLMEDEA